MRGEVPSSKDNPRWKAQQGFQTKPFKRLNERLRADTFGEGEISLRKSFSSSIAPHRFKARRG